MTNFCATCTRRCCHHYLVTVTGYDAWVIASGLRLAPEQFLVTVPQKEATSRGFVLDASGQTFEIALDKAAARTKEKPCVFWLGLPGGGGRCGIYPLRPFVCQTYPAFLQDDAVVRREDVLCPQSTWRDGTLDHPLWRNRLSRMHVEFDIYGLVVDRWNGHARDRGCSVLGYYAYLMQVYERLRPPRAAMSHGDWGAMAEAWAGALARGARPLAAPVPALAPWQETIDALVETVVDFFAGETPPPPVAADPAPDLGARPLSVLAGSC